MALTTAGATSLMHEAKVDMVTVPNLFEHLSSAETTQQLSARFAYAAAMKSINNLLLLGDGETYAENGQLLADGLICRLDPVASSRRLSSAGSLPQSSPIQLAATTKDFRHACRILQLDPNAVSDALHAAERSAGLGGADNCLFDTETGDISFNGEIIGNLGD